MLSLLKIKNIALIDEIELEFAKGLNLLTGETGSGKSIIVDSLGALTGERVSSDLIKEGESSAQIEGLFSLKANPDLYQTFYESGIELEDAEEIDLIVRRELTANGRNRIFVNNQLVTNSFLKKIGIFLVDIHGQGEQATLFNASTHLEILDEYAKLKDLRGTLSAKYRHWSNVQTELGMLRQNEAEKLQLLDILRFQVEEINKANLQTSENEALEEEKRLFKAEYEIKVKEAGEHITELRNDNGALQVQLDNSRQKITDLELEMSIIKQQMEVEIKRANAQLEDIGKEKDEVSDDLIRHFEIRLRRYLPLEWLYIAHDVTKEKEGEKILSFLKKEDYVVLLDETHVSIKLA